MVFIGVGEKAHKIPVDIYIYTYIYIYKAVCRDPLLVYDHEI